MTRLGLLVVLVVLAVPAQSLAAEPAPSHSYVAAHAANYPRAYRSPALIRYVVVHVAEGSYWGTISWFRNPRARVSAHYVVSREWQVTQMLPHTRAGWHAGNASVNLRSIGIEHEGYAGIPWTFTDAEYRASARIVAGILRSRVLPIDRRHVIGHHEVPDPRRPGRYGGYSHHTDPGPHWDWARYLAYIRAYARGTTPPPRAFDVTVPGLALGAIVGGAVRWEAVPAGAPARRVEFRVDGKLRDTRQLPPYAFGGTGAWDTTLESNGRHTLTTRAVSADGRVAGSTVVVTVKNAPQPPVRILSAGFTERQPLTGAVRWEVAVAGDVRQVEFLVDGVLRDTRTAPPWVFGGETGTWDTAAESPGDHTLTVRAAGPRGVATVSVLVVVEPPAEQPPPQP